MNKQEFIAYIDSFQKSPGEYTPEEILDISIKHRQLQKFEKDWNYLVGKLGVNFRDGEAFRKHISKLVNSNKHKVVKVEMPTPVELLEVENELPQDKTQYEKLFIQQQKTRDEWTAYRRMLREDARIESLKDTITTSINNLKNFPEVTYDGSVRGLNTEAILMVSDLHIGVECDNFYNKYNTQIAEARVMKLVDDAIYYCKKNAVKRLNIVNLGDMIHGIIHVSARIEAGIDVVEQIMVASELLSRAINKLQNAAPEVIYRSCTDNHSRSMANKSEAIEKENFNRLIDWYIESRLGNSKVKFMKDNLDVDLGKFSLMNGKTVMFSHGHNDSINQVFQHFVGATEEFIHYMLLGHYHCEKAKSFQNSRVFVNGSIVGTEQYAGSKRLFSKPSQTLLIFEDDNIINHSINLDVKDYKIVK